jgi:predicted permease
MTGVLQDVAYCVRRLARAPGFTATVAALLAFAFAANASVFAMVYALQYKPLPFPAADRAVIAWLVDLNANHFVSMPVERMESVSREHPALELMAGVMGTQLWTKTARWADRKRIETLFFQPALFGLLNLKPAVGRIPNLEDAESRDPANVLVSSNFAVDRFGSAANAIDRTLELEQGRFRVIGVMPTDTPAFRDVQIWKPATFSAVDGSGTGIDYDDAILFGRLGAGMSLAEAGERLTAQLSASPTSPPSAGGAHLRVSVQPIRNFWGFGGPVSLLLMLGTVLLIMLITGANVCNLYIARLLQLQHETAILAALGAAPRRLARIQVIEAALLSAAGAALGLALVPLGLAVLGHEDLVPTGGPFPIRLDLVTVGFVGVLALLLAIALALSGQWLQRQAADIHDQLKAGGTRQTAGVRVERTRFALIVVQIALTISLLTGAGLLARSAHKLLTEDIGFDRDRLVIAGLAMKSGGPAIYQSAVNRFQERAQALPGVRGITRASVFPFATGGWLLSYRLPGTSPSDPASWPRARTYDNIKADYFTALGQPLVAGRAFTADEAQSSAPVAIVDTVFARRHFAGGQPLGRTFEISERVGESTEESLRTLTIVGVAGDVKTFETFGAAHSDIPAIYLPGPDGIQLAIRSSIDPAVIERSLDSIARQVAPDAALGMTGAVADRIEQRVHLQYRLNGVLELLATIALGLAGVGLYAVLAYSVRMRTAEWGVRLALGADGARLERDVLWQAARLVAIGLAIGLPMAWAVTRLLASQLYEIAPFDPLTVAAVCTIIAAVSFAASWAPARAAGRVDPMTVLRRQ